MARRIATWMAVPNKIGPERVHVCPEHGSRLKSIMTLPGRVMSFSCSEGHRLDRGATVLREVEPKKK